jgi:rhomboid family protein
VFGGLSQVGGSEGGVAFWAHLGGFLAGVVLVRPFVKSNRVLAHTAVDYEPQWGRRQEW